MNAPTLPATFAFPPAIRNSSATAAPNAAARTRRVETIAPRSTEHAANATPLPLTGLLDSVRSLFNVGSIFRSADGAGFAHLYLCGFTPTPANPRLAKTALGAERTVPWSHHNNNLDLATQLLAAGATLWALETTPAAVSLFAVRPPPGPLVLVVGNEVTGVDPGLLALCTQAVAIPMHGHKRSLNVATAFGIAASVLANLWYNAKTLT